MRDLRAQGVNGFHLCTLNLEKSVTRVLEKLEWVKPGQSNKAVGQRVSLSVASLLRSSEPCYCAGLSVVPLADLSTTTTLEQTLPTHGGPLPKAVNSLRPSTPNGAPGGSASGNTVAGPDIARKDSPTSWDEFPNGRFGDARSPAYGELDGYGVGLKLPVSFPRVWQG